MSCEKPEAQKLGWEIRATSFPFETPWMKLRQDLLCTSSGETPYTYLISKGSACIVPLTSEGNIILIRQYRYPVDSWCIEVPAGGLSNKAEDISMERLALEELREEIGAVCNRLELITHYFPSNSLSQEICFVFLAVETQVVQAPTLEESEVIRPYPLSAHEAFALARSGEVKDSYSALALFFCEKRIRELGYLS